MESQLVVRVDSKVKAKFQRVVRMEGKTASEKLREMVESYVLKSDFSAVVNDLWDTISKKAQKKGVTEADIELAIKEVRVAKRKR